MNNGIVRPLAADKMIRIGWCVDHTDCLGPYTRFALWLQGCLRGCEGCISPDMQATDGGRETDIEYLAELVVNSHTEGITISGGEPFYQADKVLLLLENIKSVKSDFGVIMYSGYTYDQLIGSGEKDIVTLLGQYVDLLIDGEYIRELDDDLGIRGSSNQRLVFLTDRYRFAEKQLDSGRARQNDFFLRGNRIQMVGVPSQAAKNAIAKLNNAASLIDMRKRKDL